MPRPNQGVCQQSKPSAYFPDTPPDLRLAMFAAEREGVVSTRELHALGFDNTMIAVRVRQGHLHRIHHGVYAVGHPAISLNGRFMAAVLACGATAALSRYAAGTLDGYLTWDDRFPEVTVVGSTPRSHAGIRIHRTRYLDERDVRRNLTIPRTTVARTLLDLADDLSDKALRRAVRQAQAMNLTSVRKIATEDDAGRQAKLEADGERVLRVTYQQALAQPRQTIARLTAAGAPYTDAR